MLSDWEPVPLFVINLARRLVPGEFLQDCQPAGNWQPTSKTTWARWIGGWLLLPVFSFALNDLRAEGTPLAVERRLQKFNNVFIRKKDRQFWSNEDPPAKEAPFFFQ
jgi:hypothetical protein